MTTKKLQTGGSRGAWFKQAALPRAIAVASLFLAPASAVEAKDLGTWLNTDKKGKIQLKECGESGLCGNLVWLRDPLDEKGKPWRDQLNPDPKLRSRKVVGIDVLIGAKKIAPMTWQGQIYDPEVGKVYYLKHLKVGKTQVEIKGCLPSGWPCRTKYWTKSTPVKGSVPPVVVARKAAPKPPPAAPRVAAPTPPPAPVARPPASTPPPVAAAPPVQPVIPQAPRVAPPAAPQPVSPPPALRQTQPPETTAAIPRTSPAPRAGGYLVQVAARQSQSAALKAFNDLQRQYPGLLGGHSPEVIRADLGSRGIWYRVGIGGMPQKRVAINFCNRLKESGADCLIRAR